AAAAIPDQLALDDALAEALAFQRAQPDALVVVTTDHGNSNLGLNGMGGSYGGSSQHFAHLAAVRRSLPAMLADLQRLAGGRAEGQRTLPDGAKVDVWRVDPGHVIEVVGEGTGWKPLPARAEHFARVLTGGADPLYDQMAPPITQFGQLLANRLGIGWTGNSHTSDFAPVVARGPGAERFRGVLENTDLFTHFTALAGIDHRNPAAPLLAETGPSAAEAENWQWA
ncbi:MAG TPA: alkaline phosphatase, partial [Verrucomicrobiota bacterium]|nr:alkaline phosphatase [Verrucomicrobiota bacterium]